MIAEVAKLKQASEVNMKKVFEKPPLDSSLLSPGDRSLSQQGGAIARAPSIAEPRKPVKASTADQHEQVLPNLKLEIQKIRADSIRQEELMANGSNRSNAVVYVDPESVLLTGQIGSSSNLGKNPTAGTPSQRSAQLKKSTEKWMVPKGEQVGEQKVAIAKAFLKDREESSRGGFIDFRGSSMRNSVASVPSADNHNNSNSMSSPMEKQSVRSGQVRQDGSSSIKVVYS